jgi:hypothetical protein
MKLEQRRAWIENTQGEGIAKKKNMFIFQNYAIWLARTGVSLSS